ncbi:hypothetical protein ACRAWF_44055 [Streptomyces sp. L7]
MTDPTSRQRNNDSPIAPTASRLWRFMKPHRWGLLLSVISPSSRRWRRPVTADPETAGLCARRGFRRRKPATACPVIGSARYRARRRSAVDRRRLVAPATSAAAIPPGGFGRRAVDGLDQPGLQLP